MTEVFNIGGMTTEDLNANGVIFGLMSLGRDDPWRQFSCVGG